MIEFSNPFARPLHQLLLELSVLACTLLVFGHALHHYRRGDKRHMFQWLVITAYGVEMELVAFNFLHNYEHAHFTVQLYHGQLPLYVTGLYGSFMYTGVKIAERLRVHPIAEAFIAGFAICLIDVPFDIAGVPLAWWRWLDVDPNLAFRWLGVPVTSYYWYLVFGAVAVIECRLLWRIFEKRSIGWSLAIAPFAGLGVIIFGVIGFMPFHGLKAAGLSDGTIVAAHLAGCAVLALVARGQATKIDRSIAAVVALLPGLIAVLVAVQAARGVMADGVARAGWSLAALVGLGALGWALPLRRARAVEASESSSAPMQEVKS